MPVELAVAAGRESDLEWLDQEIATARASSSYLHHLHLYGPMGVGLSGIIDGLVRETEGGVEPAVFWHFRGMFRFASLPDCIRGMMSRPRWLRSHPSSKYQQAESHLLEVIEEYRRQSLADGNLLLYRNGGAYCATRNSPTSGTAVQMRRRLTSLVVDLLEASCDSSVDKGLLLLILEQLGVNSPEFQDWFTSDLCEELRLSSLPWSLAIVTTKREPWFSTHAGVLIKDGIRFRQRKVGPLDKQRFFELLGEHRCEREAWEWIYHECDGIPSRIPHALERWNRHRGVREEANEALVDLLPPSFQRPVPTRMLLWIQAVAAVSQCSQESLALLVGRREAALAVSRLTGLPQIRNESGTLTMQAELRAAIVAWMRKYNPDLLAECERGTALLRTLDELAPHREDRKYLGTIAPLGRFNHTILETVFPD